MNVRQFLTGLLFVVLVQAAAAADPPVFAPGEHWLAATLGHRHAGLTVLVHQPGSGEPRLRVIDLDELGIPYAADRMLRHAGENYVLADALIDHEVHLDPIMRRAHFVTRIRPHAPHDTPADLLLDIRINGVLVDQPMYVRNTGSDLVLPEETLAQLRIALPKAYGPFIEGGLPVHALAGERFFMVPEHLYLEMTIPAEQFTTTRLAAEQRGQPGEISDWSPSMVFGYNVSGSEDATGARTHAALGDLAIAAGTVTCRSRHFTQSSQEHAVRLDSSCVADWPSMPLSAGIGDHFTSSGAIGETVAYGGLWFGTDYGLQPYRNLQPSLIVDGYARLPSTLEIWMDQQLGIRQEIPPGPFIVDRLPAVSGTGELRAVLVDATGRQVLVSAPIYSDPRLLHPGVSDWRVEAGRLRPGGLDDNLYTDRFGAVTGRTGITDWLTGELHVEGTSALSMWSASTAVRLWRFGLLELGSSQSRRAADDLRGSAQVLGYSWRGDYLHAAFREIRRDAGYVSLGFPEPGDAPSVERIASAGVSFGFARLTLTGVERSYDNNEADNQKLGNAAIAISLGRLGQLQLMATRNLSLPGSEPVYGAHLSVPLGRRGHGYHSVSGLGEDTRNSTGYSLSPPTGSGIGFRVNRDAYAGSEHYFGEASYRGGSGTVSASGQRDAEGDSSFGARISGAIIASRAGVGLARDDGNSFAMVRTSDGIDDVTIRREHQDVAETSGSGTAIVSGLRPYQSNRIAIKVEDLPLSSEISTDELTVVPGRRGVVVANFGFRQQRQLLARLKLPGSGKTEIPAGSEVFVDGVPAGLVGFDGTIYVPLPDSDYTVIEARWPKGSCTATVDASSQEPLQDAGEVECYPQ